MGVLIRVPLGALMGAMPVFSREAAEAAYSAIRLWAAKVVPLPGPFLFLRAGAFAKAAPAVFLRVLLCLCCGSPGGAKLMQRKELTKREALHLAALSGTVSPAFFMGALGEWLGSTRRGAPAFLCHALGAVLTGLIFRTPNTKKSAAIWKESGVDIRELLMLRLCHAAPAACLALPLLPLL